MSLLPDQQLQITSNEDVIFGTTTHIKVGQTFKPNRTSTIGKISAWIKKESYPGDGVKCSIYSDGGTDPNSLIETSDTFVYDYLADSGYVKVDFIFDNTNILQKDNTYWFVIERTSSLNNTDYYSILDVLNETSDDYPRGKLYLKSDIEWYAPDDYRSLIFIQYSEVSKAYKLRIAQSNYNALTNSVDHMVFDSDFDTLKLKTSGNGSQSVPAATAPLGPSGTATVTIAHNLGYKPVVMVFCTSIWRDIYKFSPYAYKSIGAISPDGGSYAVDNTNLYIHLYNGDPTDARTIYYRYHIYYNELL
jgi:hypothetical protein